MAAEIGQIHGVSGRGDTTAAYRSISSEAIVDTHVVVSIARGFSKVSNWHTPAHCR